MPAQLFGGVTIPGQPDLYNTGKIDLLTIPCTCKMSRYGFAIDPPYFNDLTSEFDSEMQELEKDITSYVPPDKLHYFIKHSQNADGGEGEDDSDGLLAEDVTINAASADQIRTLLFDIFDLGSGKKLSKTKSGKVSTGKAQLREVELEHPVVPKILAYRERAKLKSTYTLGLVKKAKWHPRTDGHHRGECPVCGMPHIVGTWRSHYELLTTRAETGRFSCRNVNLQNIPQRTELGSRVRAGFMATPGMRLVSADLSQIELRVMAHIANCVSMIEIYLTGKDLHEQTAMDCFGLTDKSQIDKISHRIPAKTANFLTQYGGSAKTLYAQLTMAFLILISEGKLTRMPEWLNESWCDGFINRWFGTRPEVKDYLDLQAYRARRWGMVWDIFGRVRLVPEIKSYHPWIRAAGVRQAGNMADQGSAATMMKLIMAKLDVELSYLREEGWWAWPVITIHDQVIVECDPEIADTVLAIMLEVFDTVMDDIVTGERHFRVPIGSDGEVLDRWLKPEEHVWNESTRHLDRVVKKAA